MTDKNDDVFERVEFWERIKAAQKRNRQEYEWLARQTGKSIAELDADLTAPDPVFTEEDPAANGA